MAARLSEFGIDVSQVDYGDLSDATLDGELAMLAPFAPAAADPIPVPAGNTLYQPGRNGEPGQPIFSAPFKPEEAPQPRAIEAFVGGAKRQLMLGPDGSVTDAITRQPVDPATVTFDTPRDNSLDYNAERGFRAEFESDPRVAGYVGAQRAYQAMQSLSADETGASDVALVFSFFKTIDPSSTVREGEYAAAASAMGLPAQIVTTLQRMQSGQKLSPELRADLVNVAGQYLSRHEQDYGGALEYYQGIAPDYGFDPARVTYDARQGDIPRNPPPSGGGGGSQTSEVDPEDAALLTQNPTPEMIGFFNDLYGPGAAEQLLGGAR
jgi:hypothetical protein